MARLRLLRMISLIALLVCMAMGVDEFSAQPAFCGFRAGCDEVVRSAYGRPLGIPLPVVGLALFGAYFVLTLARSSWQEAALTGMALLIGMGGLGLLIIQFKVLHQTCPLCLLVDAAALLLAAVQIGWPPPHKSVAEAHPMLWGGFGLLLLTLPPVWGLLKPAPPVPEAVQALWNTSTVNVVEITDFTCRHCRETHLPLHRFIEQNRERVTLTRIIAPRSHHPDSRAAAKLYMLAKQLGQGEPVAEALFTTDDHSLASLRAIANQMGLAEEGFDAAMAAPELDAELTKTQTWIDAATTTGLPQIWMNKLLLLGEQTEASLNAALKRVERRTAPVARNRGIGESPE